MDPYMRRMQEYAEANRRKAIDQNVDPGQPAQPTPQSGMSQSDFAGKKKPMTDAQRQKLAELLRNQSTY